VQIKSDEWHEYDGASVFARALL